MILTSMVISDSADRLPFCRETWLMWDESARCRLAFRLPLALRKRWSSRWAKPWTYHEEWEDGLYWKVVFYGIRILVYCGRWRGGSSNLVAEVFYDATMQEARKYAEDLAMGDLLKRLKEAAAVKAKTIKVDDPETAKRWPYLFEFMTAITDGKEDRKPGQLFIRFEKGEYGICVTDPTNEIQAWYNCPALLPGLDEVNERLKTADLDWRPKKAWEGPPKGKKKA